MSGSHLHPTFKELGAVVVRQEFLEKTLAGCPLHSHHFAEGFLKQLGYFEINLAEYALIKWKKSSTPFIETQILPLEGSSSAV